MTIKKCGGCLKEIKSVLHSKIFENSSGFSFLEKFRQPNNLVQTLSLLGSVFGNSEQDNVRQFLADFFAGEIVQIADNDNEEETQNSSKDTIARAKLRIETRRWLMEQFAPHLYGTAKTVREDRAVPVFRTKVYLPENGRI